MAGPGGEWADLGSGAGAFTRALRTLAPKAIIHSVDKDGAALRRQRELSPQDPHLILVEADFRRPLDLPSLDGAVMANSLHFVRDKAAVLALVRGYLRPGGRLILVEYDTDRGNPWVPYPVSYPTWESLAQATSFEGTRLLHRVPSRHLGAIYSALSFQPSSSPSAFATDYDGTLAKAGRVDARTVAALRRLRAAGWKLVLVTGRNLDDVMRAFPELAVFDSVVAENGAVLTAGDGQVRLLGPPPPPALMAALQQRAVPYSTGRVIVHTLAVHAARVTEAIAASGAAVEPSLNKGALMLLPPSVDKALGLRAALGMLGVDPASAVGVGDAENDLSFLRICGRAYACGEALPEVRAAAGGYTPSVRRLIDDLLRG